MEEQTRMAAGLSMLIITSLRPLQLTTSQSFEYYVQAHRIIVAVLEYQYL